MAKLLAAQYALGMLVLVRFATQALVLGPVTWATGGQWRLQGRVLRLAMLRGLLHVAGIFTMFAALQYLPLAEAIAIAFVMPFIMLALGWAVLGEPVGPRRITACAVGFLGTLMVVQPTFAEVGWPALLPLAVAVIFSLFMLITRQIARETDPVGLQAVTGAAMSFVLLLCLALGHAVGIEALEWQGFARSDWGAVVALGLLGTFGHLAMTWSLRYAPSTVLAPMQYLEIPIATLIGWLVFHDLPNGMAALGILVTIAAGLSIILFERRRQQMA